MNIIADSEKNSTTFNNLNEFYIKVNNSGLVKKEGFIEHELVPIGKVDLVGNSLEALKTSIVKNEDISQAPSNSKQFHITPFLNDTSYSGVVSLEGAAFPPGTLAPSRSGNPLDPAIPGPSDDDDRKEEEEKGPVFQLSDFIEESQKLFGSGESEFPYLDVVTSDRGGVSSGKKLTSIDMCHGSARVGIERNTSGYVYMPNCCKLIYCPDCSREGGPIEKLRLSRVFGRIDVEKCNIRGFVFTVPLNVRDSFKSRNGLNSLYKMVTKIIYKTFGKNVRFSLNPHLVGDKSDIYAPHICAMIFEDLETILLLSESELKNINFIWKQALEGFCRIKIPIVNVHYEFKITVPSKLHLIRYNVRANFRYNSEMLLWISGKDFFNFSWLRFYGGLKKKGEKDMSDNLVNKKELEKQVGGKIDWVADKVSMKHIWALFGGPGLGVEAIPGPYEIYRETAQARKKRGTKRIDFKSLK